MYYKLLLPNISSPTQIMSNSATLIDKIFTNDYDNTFTPGNLVTTLSDHLAQILIVPIWNTTRHKESKKFTVIFRKFWGTKVSFPETYKILRCRTPLKLRKYQHINQKIYFTNQQLNQWLGPTKTITKHQTKTT